MTYPDFPKIECPFVRKIYKVDYKDWKAHASSLQMREPEVYLVTQEVNPGLEWVFSEDTFATEKLHGTNLLVEVKDGCLVGIQNRKNVIPILKIIGKQDGLLPSGRFLEGILNAAQLTYLDDNTVQYGEFIGPSMNQNIHKLDKHLWYPFKRAKSSLRYKSFEKHPKEFFGWSEWFRTGLKSMLYCRMNKISLSNMWSDEVPFTEGIVIYQQECDGRERMAKLRRDMYDWYFGEKVKILGLEDWRVEQAKKCGYKLKGYES